MHVCISPCKYINILIIPFLLLTVPDLVSTNQSSIFVLAGESVTLGCIPSDRNLTVQWNIRTMSEIVILPEEYEGSAEIFIPDDRVDDEESTETTIANNSLRTRLQYQLPLIYHITLINAMLDDNGIYECQIKPPPNEEPSITQQISVFVLQSEFTYLLK